MQSFFRTPAKQTASSAGASVALTGQGCTLNQPARASAGKGMGSVVGAGAQPYRSTASGSGYGGGYGQRSGAGQGQYYGRKEESFKDLTAPIPKAMAQAKTEGGLRVGQSVFHNKFGEGVVLTLEGSGPDARVQVNFGRHGTKWLMLSVAKLTPIE